jgi:hypothetical protein
MKWLWLLFILLFSSCYTLPIADRDAFIESIPKDILSDTKPKEDALVQQELDTVDTVTPLEKTVQLKQGDIFYRTALDSGEEWFKEEFIDEIESQLNEKSNIVLSEQDTQKLRRYLMLRGEEGSGLVTDFGQQLVEAYSGIKEQKEILRQDFEEKWHIYPSEPLFNDTVAPRFDSTLRSSKPIPAEYYHGEDQGIRFLLEYYHKVIKVYGDAGQNISKETMELLEENFMAATTELKLYIENEKKAFAQATSAFQRETTALDIPFRQIIADNARSLSWDSLSPSPDFDYIISRLPDEQEPALIIYNKTLSFEEDMQYFRERGLAAEILGVMDTSIYVCQDGKILLFDAFTLKKKIELFGQRENILFVFHADEYMVVTKSNNGYNLKEIEKNKDYSYKLKSIKRSKEK